MAFYEMTIQREPNRLFPMDCCVFVLFPLFLPSIIPSLAVLPPKKIIIWDWEETSDKDHLQQITQLMFLNCFINDSLLLLIKSIVSTVSLIYWPRFTHSFLNIFSALACNKRKLTLKISTNNAQLH